MIYSNSSNIVLQKCKICTFLILKLTDYEHLIDESKLLDESNLLEHLIDESKV